MFKLFIAIIKMTYRNKQALFWSFAFPLMFIIIFGLFDFSKMGNASYLVVDQANSALSNDFLSGLSEIEFLKRVTNNSSTVDDALASLKKGDVQFVISIPESFTMPAAPAVEAKPATAQQIPTALPKPGTITVYYDESNVTSNQIILSVIDKFFDKMNISAAQAPTIFSYTTQNVQTKSIKYLDIIMTGILGMAIMTSTVIGLSTAIAQYREQRLLKRLSATPLKIRDFLMAEVLAHLVLTVAQVTLIILFSRLVFHVHVYGSYLILYIISIIGGLIFLNIGFAVGGYAKSIQTAASVSQVVTMPMMFLSGTFFSVETLPVFLQKVVQFLPLTPMISAIRKVSVEAAGWHDIQVPLLYMLGWVAVSFLIAWRSFRFKDA
jgi:ABC-2 type transport system permease protein